jgi:hypothetical protein
LNVERGVRGNKNVEEGVGSEYRAIGGKDQSRGWWNELKGPDEVSEVAREHRPDESEKSTLTPLKSSDRVRNGGLNDLCDGRIFDQAKLG